MFSTVINSVTLTIFPLLRVRFLYFYKQTITSIITKYNNFQTKFDSSQVTYCFEQCVCTKDKFYELMKIFQFLSSFHIFLLQIWWKWWVNTMSNKSLDCRFCIIHSSPFCIWENLGVKGIFRIVFFVIVMSIAWIVSCSQEFNVS